MSEGTEFQVGAKPGAVGKSCATKEAYQTQCPPPEGALSEGSAKSFRRGTWSQRGAHVF